MKKINFPTGTERAAADEIRGAMQEKITLPVSVQMAKAEAFAKVRAQSEKNAQVQKKRRRSVWRPLGSVAAAAAVFSGVCIANPAFAEKIPLVGHVFAQIGSGLGFQGDYERYAVALEETEPRAVQILNGTEQNTQDPAQAGTEPETVQTEVWAPGKGVSYSGTENGMTVTLSELYCNEKALYLSMILHTEDTFPDTMTDMNGQPIISLLGSTIDLSYNPNTVTLDNPYLDGQMIDAHTYAAMLRMDLKPTLSWYVPDESPESGAPEVDAALPGDSTELPEQFTAHLVIPQVQGTLAEPTTPEIPAELKQKYNDAMAEAGLSTKDEDYASFTEEQQELEHRLFTEMMNAYAQQYPEVDQFPNKYENWWVDGPWTFDLDVTVDHRETVTKTINADEACDIGPIDVTITPFELVLDYDYDRAAQGDYFVAVLDADGEPLEYGHAGGTTDDHPIIGRDVSKVYVYVCDYIEYMDELKGYYFADDYEEKAKEKTYQQLLEERCVWSGEADF